MSYLCYIDDSDIIREVKVGHSYIICNENRFNIKTQTKDKLYILFNIQKKEVHILDKKIDFSFNIIYLNSLNKFFIDIEEIKKLNSNIIINNFDQIKRPSFLVKYISSEVLIKTLYLFNMESIYKREESSDELILLLLRRGANPLKLSKMLNKNNTIGELIHKEIINMILNHIEESQKLNVYTLLFDESFSKTMNYSELMMKCRQYMKQDSPDLL